jgi:predicted DNA-binding transcriptional regulator AlpA
LLCDYGRNQFIGDYGCKQWSWQNDLVTRKIDPKDIVGAHEIAERLNLSFPNVVHNWRSRHVDFPKPIAELTAGVFWDWKEVKAWLKATKRYSD